MMWSEIPVSQVHDSELAAITPRALELLRENILDNGDHPLIVIWSIAIIDPLVDSAQASYIEKAVALGAPLTRRAPSAWPSRPAADRLPGRLRTAAGAGRQRLFRLVPGA